MVVGPVRSVVVAGIGFPVQRVVPPSYKSPNSVILKTARIRAVSIKKPGHARTNDITMVVGPVRIVVVAGIGFGVILCDQVES